MKSSFGMQVRHPDGWEPAQFYSLLSRGSEAQILALIHNPASWDIMEQVGLCLLCELCRRPEVRSLKLVGALLDAGFPVEGMRPPADKDSPLAEVLAHPGTDDVDLVRLLLRHGAKVERSSCFGTSNPSMDYTAPIWVQVLRTLREDMLDAVLDSGWRPEDWREWPVDYAGMDRASDRYDPLRALRYGVVQGLFRGISEVPRDHRCLRAIQILHQLSRHGFNAQATDLNAVTVDTPWYRRWLQEHEEALLQGTIPTSSSPPINRTRL